MSRGRTRWRDARIAGLLLLVLLESCVWKWRRRCRRYRGADHGEKIGGNARTGDECGTGGKGVLVASQIEDLRAGFSREEYPSAGVPWLVGGDDAGVELAGGGPRELDG